MPHITVLPFDTTKLSTAKLKNSHFLFHGKDVTSDNEIVGVEVKNEQFLLHIKKTPLHWIVKFDKITRPLDVNLVKLALQDMRESLSLDIIHENINMHSTRIAISDEFQKSIDDFYNLDFDFESVSVEVGFGSGRHILYQATLHPNRLYIGVEIHTPSATQLLKQIKIQNLKNIWVVNFDARLLLEMLPSNLLSEVFVHFPVPWDKKPYRRVISSIFLSETMRVLKADGVLNLRTDSYNYFWYSLDVFFNTPLKTSVLIDKNRSLEVTSKYEARWLRQEKDIYDVSVTSLEDSPQKEDKIDFLFKNSLKSFEKLLNVKKEAVIYGDFFVHYDKIYKVFENFYLLKVVFGSFDKPESKYIIFNENESQYFGTLPVKSSSNYKAHLKIREDFDV